MLGDVQEQIRALKARRKALAAMLKDADRKPQQAERSKLRARKGFALAWFGKFTRRGQQERSDPQLLRELSGKP